MQSKVVLNELIKKAVEIKNNGGINLTSIKLSNSEDDTINRVNKESIRILNILK